MYNVDKLEMQAIINANGWLTVSAVVRKVYAVVRMVDGIQLVCYIHTTKDGAEKQVQELNRESYHYTYSVEEYCLHG